MGAAAGELSSRLAHPAWPTGGAAVLALLVLAYLLVIAVYLLYFPGLMLFLVVLSVNFIGEGLQDAFDPQGSGR